MLSFSTSQILNGLRNKGKFDSDTFTLQNCPGFMADAIDGDNTLSKNVELLITSTDWTTDFSTYKIFSFFCNFI